MPSLVVSGFLLTGSSTLFRILKDCAASVRKSIEGLDYFVAEAGRAFCTLEEVIKELDTADDKREQLKSLLLNVKQYLKSDYKV